MDWGLFVFFVLLVWFCGTIYAIGFDAGANKERRKAGKIDFYDERIGGGGKQMRGKDMLLGLGMIYILIPLLGVLLALLMVKMRR